MYQQVVTPEMLHEMHLAQMRFEDAVNKAANAERPDTRVHDEIVFSGPDANQRSERFQRRLSLELEIHMFERWQLDGRLTRIAQAKVFREFIAGNLK